MNHTQSSAALRPLAVIGRGRLGGALVQSLSRGGCRLVGPLGRDYDARELADVAVVLLCVPDREIAAAAAVAADRLSDHSVLVGHCSGATGLQPLLLATGGRFEVFSLHPLMTVADDREDGGLAGAAAAVCGSSEHARLTAAQLARAAGMAPVTVEEDDRAAYHAAASLASNFLVTLEVAAERLAAGTGLQRAQLVPLVRRTVENWAAHGAGALTGPIARGDERTVELQREAIAQRTPDLLDLFDALATATRTMADAVPA